MSARMQNLLSATEDDDDDDNTPAPPSQVAQLPRPQMMLQPNQPPAGAYHSPPQGYHYGGQHPVGKSDGLRYCSVVPEAP
jgi:hypothetical protein